MIWKSSGFIFIFSFICFYAFPENESKIRNIIIYPFFNIQSDCPERYLYLSDTIPDIIKQEIIDKALFYLIEKSEFDDMINNLGVKDDYYKNENLRIVLAKELKADYFCWGYFLYENESLIVYFHLVSVKTKRTIKIEKGVYDITPDIFQKIETKSHEFADWVNTELPQKSIDKEPVLSETNNSANKKLFYFNYLLKRNFEFEASFLYTFYLFPYDQYVKNNFSGEFSFKYFIPKATFLYAGFSIMLNVLEAKNDVQYPISVLLINLPLFLKFGINLNLFKYLEVDFSFGNGVSVYMGYLIDKLDSYVRPCIVIDFDIYFTPVKYFKIGCGLIFSTTFAVYSNMTLFSLSPRLSIAASF